MDPNLKTYMDTDLTTKLDPDLPTKMIPDLTAKMDPDLTTEMNPDLTTEKQDPSTKNSKPLNGDMRLIQVVVIVRGRIIIRDRGRPNPDPNGAT